MRYLISAMIMLTLFAPALGQTGYETGAQALSVGNDQEALAACQHADRVGQASFGSLYNEGLALRNLGQPARARASFERAVLLEPHSLAARRRLRDMDAELGEKVTSLDVTGTPWWSASEGELLVLLPGFAMLALGAMARAKGNRLAATPMLTTFLVGLGALALIYATSPARERAIVVDKTAQLLPEPAPDKPGDKVPAGVMVEILERSDHFTKVRLGDDRTGWLRRAQMVELALPAKATKAPLEKRAVDGGKPSATFQQKADPKLR